MTVATSVESAAVSLPPSLRWKTSNAPGWVAVGNAFVCRSVALIDSYFDGRKLDVSWVEVSLGANVATTTASTTQAPMMYQGKRFTKRPRAANMGQA